MNISANSSNRPGTFRLLPGLLLAIALVLNQLPAGAEDVPHGERLYWQCEGCHSMSRNRIGPRHCGLIGRKAGNVPGFRYSKAMKDSGIIWNRKTLNTFLANPLAMVPGSTMGIAGINNEQDRRALILYIESASRSKEICGSG